MKLSTLNYFVAVATEKSFTKASEKLFISQPTLSRRIQELETELGVTLFIRQSHSLKLSREGERFLIETTDVLERVDHLAHMFDQQANAGQTAVILKIGYLPNFNLGHMYKLLDRFKAEHTNVQFLMNQDIPLNLADGLDDGRYDLVFGLTSYFKTNKNIKKSLFMKNHLQIAIPIQHPLSQQQNIVFADLKQETFILLERQQSPVIVDYVINQGLKNGFNLKANYYVKDLDEGLSMVSMGKGLAFLYSGMNDGTLEEKYHIKISDLENVGRDQDIISAINKSNDNKLLQELFAFIKRNSSKL
ncbi:LysR family transcriptional regulator [Loigolactobacillus backii]|uniref:LysR family transcriptional regulator n=1 Tax=Loigolactobacillus backii TaxID=375175 RepID=A0A192H2A0_9LACO|nr:LysR family transcriptional regulator [Loigolactobacillus backii]ANK60195.1 LysR family transcriptional regulator [Loigolactobacillus backii]ANK62362.1 LysR family transcriptional regulator [Loigolactobacillus backii]ANK65077.1 LysR family transcriptional regulator [Loigolactobacillus backii]ANK67636.1 LysR family transcriptional regulator [Loigolactobacillus backii]ANK70626.1 LysR family transcriptional regulator [Loigolactobacillus backii]